MNSILFASLNRGKIEEMSLVAREYGFSIISPYDLSASPPEVVEDRETYLENARKKANEFSAWSKDYPTIADDSGLEVAALDGKPGLMSARLPALMGSSKSAVECLLELMQELPEREAKFICTLVFKGAEEFSVVAELPGQIALEPQGDGGFGYDPIFLPQNYTQSLSELKSSDPLFPTHRVIAAKKLFEKLKSSH